jgi:CRISPR system Cascade subunit CasD
MATLLLRLQGPMQSWGTRSRLNYRNTWPYPTKSGVVGLLAAALGRDRTEDVSDLAALRLGIRVDREGTLKVDYQTAQNVLTANLKHKRNEQSWRYYLSDAAFLAGLEGDEELLQHAHRALRAPRFPLYLGRKSYVPSPPPYLPDGLVDMPLQKALQTYPCLVENRPEKKPFKLILESSEGRMVYDQPAGPFSQRRFAARHVQEYLLDPNTVPKRQPPQEESHVD